MTPLRKKMVDDITVRGLAENTIRTYILAVKELASHYGRSPDCIEPREVQEYLLHPARKARLSTAHAARVWLVFFYFLDKLLWFPYVLYA